MNIKQIVLAASAIALFAPAARCQALPPLPAPTTMLDGKAMSSAELKEAITSAVTSGDLDAKDGKELIDKIVDIETLMDQFDFIRDQERNMMSSVGSSFH